MSQITLHYFNISGKGEPIRLCLHYAGLAFDDHRFASRDEFKAMKESGKLRFGQVPALVVDGVVVNQSAAIMRLVAQLAAEKDEARGRSLYPAGDRAGMLQAALIDGIMDLEADAFAGLRVTKYKERFGFSEAIVPAEVFEQATAAINGEVIPRHLGNLERILAESKTGWLAGTPGPSIADFFWAPVLASLGAGWTGDKDALKAFPGLVALADKFQALPEIQAYYAAKKKKEEEEAKA